MKRPHDYILQQLLHKSNKEFRRRRNCAVLYRGTVDRVPLKNAVKTLNEKPQCGTICQTMLINGKVRQGDFDMASIQYTLTKFLFKSLVRPMMKKAAADPEKFLQEQYKAQQKKTRCLPQNTLRLPQR